MRDFSDQKLLNDYYDKLKQLQNLGIMHEQGTRIAFQTLLDALGKQAGWNFVPEEKLSNRKRPDGTFYDNFKLPRGYWEAKDTSDDLDNEIQNKIRRDYPLTNTIFEDTQRAVLFQHGREAGRFDLTQPAQLGGLLNKFFNYTEEDIEGFHQAVSEFQSRIPTLAGALQGIIHESHENNEGFRKAFGSFHAVCQSALNPAISAKAIEEMLVQHLLTERLFRTVFDNPHFVQQNVIAEEIEGVIRALVGGGFQRQQFLRSLDHFYTVIEKTAGTLHDWGEKQGFLNTVYERFFQGYSVNQADTMGIVYTPQPIVDWMVASVDRVLQDEFGQELSTRGVQIVDPCTGTGNFIVNILRRINGRDLNHKYREDIFANEIMLLPYYIASLNIEHAYYERTGQYLPFEGVCFADTLDLNETNLFSEANTDRIKREQAANITVIIGNPPYNVGQKNENDNNKNRKYEKLDRRIKDTYAKASKATNKNALSDPYVKFFRWATERLGNRDGIVCFVSNNSVLNQAAFDGMRQHLAADFNQIYHLDLHGNVRQNPKLSGITHNVFGIQVGVGITIAVRKKGAPSFIKYHRVPEFWRATEKLSWITQTNDINGVEWQTLTPDAKNNWITEGLHDEFDEFLLLGSKEVKAGINEECIFSTYGRGVATSRDLWAYDWERKRLSDDIQRMIATYNAEVERWEKRDRAKVVAVDDFVQYTDKEIKWSRDLKLDLQRGNKASFSEDKIRHALYRPFCRQWLFLDRILNEEVYVFPRIYPTPRVKRKIRFSLLLYMIVASFQALHQTALLT